MTAGCRDNTTSVDCSGRGSCVCGVCQCESRPNPEEVRFLDIFFQGVYLFIFLFFKEISGQYCECDNFSCERNNGILCSGLDHGICKCGICQCLPGWTGDSCNCKSSTDSCIPPGTFFL